MKTYVYGRDSRAQLDTCHPDLVRLAEAIIRRTDAKCHEGRRTLAQQRLNVAKNVSWTLYSKHIPTEPDGLSDAFDLSYWPMDWTDKSEDAIRKHYWFAGVVRGTAWQLGIKIRWGGDWDDDHNLKEEKRRDLVHFELVR